MIPTDDHDLDELERQDLEEQVEEDVGESPVEADEEHVESTDIPPEVEEDLQKVADPVEEQAGKRNSHMFDPEAIKTPLSVDEWVDPDSMV
jgi:hypothetical protein